MGLFAASVLAGALIAIVLPDPKPISDWLAKHLGFFFGLLLFLILVYTILWLHYADIVAPSKAFRMTHFFIRVLAVLPLLIAAGAVGFESVRWLLRIRWGEDKHITTHGIGVGAAGLVVLGLFLFQDERMSGLIASVKTPVFSIDLNKDAPASPLVAANNGSNGANSVDSDGEEDDRVVQSISIIRTLASTIEGDFKYAEALGTDRLSANRKKPLESDVWFYKETLVAFGKCIIALRQRVRDEHPLIIVGQDAAHDLRVAHRMLLNGKRPEFEISIALWTARYLPQIFERVKFIYEQHSLIIPAFEKPSDLKPCEDLDRSAFSEIIRSHMWMGGITTDGPYFTLIVAAALNLAGEKRSAVEEIDLWLRHIQKKEKKYQQNAKFDFRTRKSSADYRHMLIMRMRAEYWAGRLLLSDPDLAIAGARRFRRAVDILQEIFSTVSIPEQFNNGTTLTRLIQYVDRRTRIFQEGSRVQCDRLAFELRKLLFSALAMINTISYIAATIEPQLPYIDHEDFMRKHYTALGFIEPTCFNDILRGDYRVRFVSALADTYIAAKLKQLRELPKERARLEVCELAKVLDRAIDYNARLTYIGRAKKDQNNFTSAEEIFKSVRLIYSRIKVAQQIIDALGTRAC